MTDHELLKMAAKAAGYWSTEFNCAADLPHLGWNPLTDDGDALRLAVKLRMLVDHIGPHQAHMPNHIVAVCSAAEVKSAAYEPEGPDPYAATRRAIVHAAAEIGKEMK